jgi:hypothetical protein
MATLPAISSRVTELKVDGFQVRVAGSMAPDTIRRHWTKLQKSHSLIKKFRLWSRRFEGNPITPGVVFIDTPKIPRTLKIFLDAQEHARSPVVYVVDPDTVNEPAIRSLISLDNADFFVSAKKAYTRHDFESALELALNLATALPTPDFDNRISNQVAAETTSLGLENPATGRLDAFKIAECYGIAPSALAEIVGVSRQSLLKTPDSPHRQSLLRPFAKLPQLAVGLLGSPEKFRVWLNEPNEELYQHVSPMDLVRRGQVADALALVQDQLLGTPA